MKRFCLLLCILCSLAAAEEPSPKVVALAESLLAAQEELQSVPFRQVMQAVSGHQVLECREDEAVAAEILAAIRRAAEAVMRQLNQPDSLAKEQRRINEVSRVVEDLLRAELSKQPGISCEIPTNGKGAKQRSGYPDLLIRHAASGRVAYLDPKLFETSQRDSSLRTFYFQPRRETNKVQEDAHHLLLGFEHDGKVGQWRFLAWKIIDLHDLKLQLKAEFHASNRDTYREEMQRGESQPQE